MDNQFSSNKKRSAQTGEQTSYVSEQGQPAQPAANTNESNEWMASVAQENQYLANQIMNLEADKQRLVNELRAMSQKNQADTVKRSEHEKVTKSLHQLEEKSGALEKQLLQAKEYIDQLSSNPSIVSPEEYEKLVEEKQQITEKMKNLEAEKQNYADQSIAFDAISKQLATKTTETESLTNRLAEMQEEFKTMELDLDESQKKIGRLNLSVDRLQQELVEEQSNHNSKNSPEYRALSEENERLRTTDPKTSIEYLDLLEEKNVLADKLKNFNPKSTNEYLELLVTVERQRAQIAEMNANQEMVHITEDEIRDILSEAQYKGRKIVERAEAKAAEILKTADQQIAEKQKTLDHHDEGLKALIAEANDAFALISNHGQELETQLEQIYRELKAEKQGK